MVIHGMHLPGEDGMWLQVSTSSSQHQKKVFKCLYTTVSFAKPLPLSEMERQSFGRLKGETLSPFKWKSLKTLDLWETGGSQLLVDRVQGCLPNSNAN